MVLFIVNYVVRVWVHDVNTVGRIDVGVWGHGWGNVDNSCWVAVCMRSYLMQRMHMVSKVFTKKSTNWSLLFSNNVFKFFFSELFSNNVFKFFFLK